MAQNSGDETRKELERLYKCVAYDRIDDVDRMELWIKEVGIVVEKLSALDRKQHELELLDRIENSANGAESGMSAHIMIEEVIKSERERLSHDNIEQ